MKTHSWRLRFISLVTLLALSGLATSAPADIFQWEYINPADPNQGKQQSTTLTPGGGGANAARGTDLSDRDLTKAYLPGADVSALTVVDQGHILYTINSNLTAVNLSEADLTNARFGTANIAGANFAGADIRGAAFSQNLFYPGSGLTLAQLYSTTSYLARDLRGVSLGGDYAGANFAGQNLASANLGSNLTNAVFTQANLRDAGVFGSLAGADLSGADVRGARFSRYGFPLGGLTLAQIYSTASYQIRDLSGIDLSFNDLTGGDFADHNFVGAGLVGSVLAQVDFSRANLSGAAFTSYYSHPEFPEFYAADLTDANLSHANLTNAIIWSVPGMNAGVDLTGADARGAEGFDPIPATALVSNFIRPNGHLEGLNLTAGASLEVRDYDGNPAAYPMPTGPLPIVVEEHLTVDASGTLGLVFDADTWDSTISFAPGIPVQLGGTLELAFAPAVNLTGQLGRTINLFDWTDVTPTGAFNVTSPYQWDLTQLYVSGEVTLIGIQNADFNGDGTVNGDDLTKWKANFGASGNATHMQGDADGDHDVDGADLLTWQRQLGSLGAASRSTSASEAVPEPSATMMLFAGLLVRRKLWRPRP